MAPVNAAFPTAFSVPSADALLAEVTRHYSPGDLGGASAAVCRLWHLGTNTTFQVRTQSGQEFMLRVCPAGWRTRKDVLWEMDLLTHLSAQGISVALPIPCREGGFVFELPAPEGPRLCTLFALAPGRDIGPDAAACRLLGGAVARMHIAAATFTSAHSRFPLDLTHLLDEPLACITSFLQHRPDDLVYVAALADRVRERIDPLAATGTLEWGACHGDVQGANAFIDADRVTLFDFDCGGMGWFAYDAAVFRWIVERFGWDVACWESFRAGYTEVRPLSDAETAALPWLVAAREIWLGGMHTEPAAVARWGYDKYRARYFDRFLRALREWDAAHLGSVSG